MLVSFFVAAQSIHAQQCQTPPQGAQLRVQGTLLYRERCGIEMGKGHGGCYLAPTGVGGGLTDHCQKPATNIGGKVVLLCTDTHSIMKERFGTVTAVTFWSPGGEEAKVYRMTAKMEEECEAACLIIIGEAEKDGFQSGGPFRGATYDRDLQVPPLSFLHGVMRTLVYTREALGTFSLQRLQLGVGGSKGHTGQKDVHRTRLVQGTLMHGPLVLMVNRIAMGLVPLWFTWTTIQLSRNAMKHPPQHRFDATRWSAVFSTGQHSGGKIWVEEGRVHSWPPWHNGGKALPGWHAPCS